MTRDTAELLSLVLIRYVFTLTAVDGKSRYNKGLVEYPILTIRFEDTRDVCPDLGDAPNPGIPMGNEL